MSRPSTQQRAARFVPWLAGAAGAILAVVVAVAVWVLLVIAGATAERGGISPTEAATIPAVLALAAALAAGVAYPLGIPLAIGIEALLARARETIAVWARYPLYAALGLLLGGVIGAAAGAAPAAVGLLGAGAAVAGAAIRRLAQRRLDLGRRLALSAPLLLLLAAAVLQAAS